MLTNGEPGDSAMQEVQRWALRHYLDLETPTREVVENATGDLDAAPGHYRRHDATIDIWRVDDHLHIERRVVEHEDQFSTERHADDPPTTMDAYPTGDGVFRVLEGPQRDALIEVFETRLFGDDDTLVSRQVLRAGGRLAERVGDAPASGPTTDA